MFISCIKGDAINVDYIVHLRIANNKDGNHSIDAEMLNGNIYIMAEDKDSAVLQEYLDDLVSMININRLSRDKNRDPKC